MKKSFLRFSLSALFCLITLFAHADVVVWQENFDDGDAYDRWGPENGVWQIGSPTDGPATNSLDYRTHSGPNCATTGLTANYPAFADSRLIRIAAFVVPAATNYPRLRFWQWYRVAGAYCNPYCDEGSYGYVEIKIGTGSWQQISPNYTSTSSDIWSRPALDLSPYAGKTIQLAFHFHSARNSALGWFVDDVALVTGTPVFNGGEGFELGLGDWSTESGTWEVGVPSNGPQAAYGGTNCA